MQVSQLYIKKNIVLSSLYIELWVVKVFYGGHIPEYHVQQKLPRISDKHVKEGIFAGHRVKELANGRNFYKVMKETVLGT
jgi:hypothetical protein